MIGADFDKIWENSLAMRRKYENDEGGIESNIGVHCPTCGHFEGDGFELGESGVYAEGDHDFTCASCGADFRVETSIEYTWTSTTPEAE